MCWISNLINKKIYIIYEYFFAPQRHLRYLSMYWYKKKSKEFQVFALETSVIGWLIWGLATSGMQSFVTLLDSSLPLSEASRRNTIHTVCHSEPLSFMWALLSKVSLKMSIDLHGKYVLCGFESQTSLYLSLKHHIKTIHTICHSEPLSFKWTL